MSMKVGCISHDMRISGRIAGVRSTEQSVGIGVLALSTTMKTHKKYAATSMIF